MTIVLTWDVKQRNKHANKLSNDIPFKLQMHVKNNKSGYSYRLCYNVHVFTGSIYAFEYGLYGKRKVLVFISSPFNVFIDKQCRHGTGTLANIAGSS